MKVAIMLLLCSIQILYASDSFSQNAKVSINKKDVQLDQILTEIEKQTDYLFIYNNQVKVKQKVSVDVADKPVSTLLTDLFKGTNIKYSMEGKHIILSSKEEKLSGPATQQDRMVSGAIVDRNGEPLIGVSIVLKGTTIGTVTDFDGKFNLNVPDGHTTLVVTYVGYTPQEISIGNKTIFNIILQEDNVALDEVVVTALGIKRAEKALSYNVQKITNEDLTTVRDANFMNSLAGKVAGVNINASATGIGGATRVVMRGTKSITKDNNAFYVIDGVPIMNTNRGALEENSEYNLQPRSESIADINPDDIESMTVLTGPSAAALYGSDAANGAIIITTKRGKAGKPQITVSNQTTFSKPLIMPKFQNQYGNKPGEYASWGDKLSNPSSYDPEDFFNTGYNTQTSVSLSVGSEKNQTYVSFSDTRAEGIIPNNTFQRNNVTIRNTTSFLNDKMTLDFGFSYVKQKDMNMISQGQYFNPLLPLYTYPRGESFDEIRMYERYNEGREIYEQMWEWGDQALSMQNPYWLVYRNKQGTSRNRYMANLSLKYDIFDWLNVTGRVRMDESNGDFTRRLHASTLELFSGKNGFYRAQKEDDKQMYADVIVNLNKRWGDYSLFANVGTSIFDTRNNILGAQGPLKTIPNFFSLQNVDRNGRDAYYIQERWHDQTQSIFASAEAGWKSMLYLTVTGRNDWASPLANTSTSSFFYPSVGLSGVISEMVKLPEFISYMKVRGSFASVGSAIPRNISIPTYLYDKQTDKWQTNTYKPINDLKPERTGSWEVGLTTKMLGDRINFDVTLYKSNTKNQTFLVPISFSSTWKEMYIQSGNVENKGLEASIGYNQKIWEIDWNTSFTASYNKNKVIELVDNYYDPDTGEYISLDEYSGGGTGSLEIRLTKGGTMGDLWTKTALEKDQNGNIYVNPITGDLKVANELKKVGSVLPKWNLGFRNDFAWRDISLGFLVTARIGGVVASPTQALLDGFGVTEATADMRNESGIVVNNGVIDAQKWYETIGRGGVYSHYIYSATNVRLQELSLGYTLPKKWFDNKLNVKASLVGRNLWMIYNKAPFDPELTASTGTYYQGIDYFMQPSLRSIGFNIQVKF